MTERDREALRLWQCARALAKRGERIAAFSYYRQCVSVIRGGGECLKPANNSNVT
jgi:hypothetical protein